MFLYVVDLLTHPLLSRNAINREGKTQCVLPATRNGKSGAFAHGHKRRAHDDRTLRGDRLP